MNKVLKKALGFAGALGLTAVMVLAAAPVQASDVDARIQVLERELAQLKQNQESESALAAEMKAPAVKYTAGKGLTIAAADNAWSLNIGMVYRIFSTFYLTHDDDTAGTGNGVIHVVRHRPDISVTSGGGFYRLYSQWKVKGGGVDSDLYLNFGKTNPWLPNVGIGSNPSFAGAKTLGSTGRPDDSPLQAALSLGGSQDRSIVLAWSGLPAMSTAKLTHLNLAIGHENNGGVYDATAPNSDSRSTAFGMGIAPFAQIEAMGGLDISSVNYSFGYQKLPDQADSVTIKSGNASTTFTLADAGSVTGEHDYQAHGLSWKPVGFLSVAGTYINFESKGGGENTKANEFKLSGDLSVWSAKGGLMGTGGLTLSPEYSVADLDWTGGNSAEVTNYGFALRYLIPGGAMSVTGIWENHSCEGGGCADMSAATGNAEDDSFNTFTIFLEYNF